MINSYFLFGIALVTAMLFFTPTPGMAQQTKLGSPAESSTMHTLNIKDMTFREFASLLSQSSGKQVVVSQAAGAILVNVYLCDMEVEDALAAVCNAYQCWYKKDESTGVISIITADEYLSGLSYNEKELVKVVKLRYLDARQLGDTLRNLYRDRVVWERPEEDESENLEELEMAIERMNILSENALTSDNNSGTSSSSRDSSNSRYGSSSRYGSNGRYGSDSHYGSRYTSSTSDELEKRQQIELEREALLNQLIEARARGEEGLYNRPGVVYLSVYRDTNALLIRTTDQKTMRSLLDAIEEMDKPKPQVLIEVKVLEIKLEDEDSQGVDWLFQSGDLSGGRSTGLLTPFDNSPEFHGEILPPDGNLFPQGTALTSSAGLLQVASDHVLARLQMLEDENRLTGLATPNLCVADGEVSRVFVGSETTVLLSVSSDTTVNTGSDINTIVTETEVETERRNVGMTLLITPEIHSDESVTIRIVQEDSQLGSIRAIEYNEENFQSQDVETRSVTTTVVAHDGEISAVGGLIREIHKTRDSGIKGLKNVPVFGNLFKAKSRIDSRTELIVLMRPYILLAPGEGEVRTQNMLRRFSEHPGVRDDFSPLGIGHGEFASESRELSTSEQKSLEELQQNAGVWETE